MLMFRKSILLQDWDFSRLILKPTSTRFLKVSIPITVDNTTYDISVQFPTFTKFRVEQSDKTRWKIVVSVSHENPSANALIDKLKSFDGFLIDRVCPSEDQHLAEERTISIKEKVGDGYEMTFWVSERIGIPAIAASLRPEWYPDEESMIKDLQKRETARIFDADKNEIKISQIDESHKTIRILAHPDGVVHLGSRVYLRWECDQIQVL